MQANTLMCDGQTEDREVITCSLLMQATQKYCDCSILKCLTEGQTDVYVTIMPCLITVSSQEGLRNTIHW